MILVLILGLLPVILLLGYTYKLDSIEREPIGLILKLILFGAITTIAAGIFEQIGARILWGISWVLGRFGVAFPLPLYLAIEYFLIVGLAEEGIKYLALRKATWYHKAFNYRFDAVIYAVAVALGFAACENIMYILHYGLGVAPIRAITAIPMHAICGVFMGHYYGEAKLAESRHRWTTMEWFQRAAVIIPVLLHGFYDFAASSQDPLLSTLFLVYVVVVDIVAFLCVRHYARRDTPV